MSTRGKSQLGAIGEAAAAEYLAAKGFKIIALNYARPYGEIDLVATKQGVVHFVEVKASKYYPDSAFLPEIRVNAKKVRNLKKICETYIRESGLGDGQPWPIDVISVILRDSGAIKQLKHIENAVFEKGY